MVRSLINKPIVKTVIKLKEIDMNKIDINKNLDEARIAYDAAVKAVNEAEADFWDATYVNWDSSAEAYNAALKVRTEAAAALDEIKKDNK